MGALTCPGSGTETVQIGTGDTTIGVAGSIEGCVTHRIATDTGSGRIVTDFIPYCPGGPGGAGGGDAGGAGAAREPPPPPTHAEIVAGVCPPIPEPSLGRNPLYEGVTGLDTYLWAGAHEVASSGGSIRGYPVQCTVTPMSYRFTTGDGGDYTTTTAGGTHPHQAATHLYETLGDYTLTLAVRWERATTAGADAPVGTVSQPYHVYEVRPVLQ